MTNTRTLKSRNHFLDKPILRDFFWFIVLPYKLKHHVEEQKAKEKFCDDNCNWLDHHPLCKIGKDYS